MLTHRTLIKWGIIEVIYAFIIGGIAFKFIPKNLMFQMGLMIFAVLHLISGLGLLLKKKSLWQLSLLLGYLSIFVCLILTCLCLSSVFYWLQVYGVLGWGVGIAGSLLISGVLQLLGLYPALKLHILKSKEIADFFKVGEGLTIGKRIVYLPLISVLIGTYLGYMPTYDRINDIQKNAITQVFRDLLIEDGDPDLRLAQLKLHLDPVKAEVKSQKEQIFVNLWMNGERQVRVSGNGDSLYEAVAQALLSFRTHEKISGFLLNGGQIEVERVIGAKDLPFSNELFVALSVNPGVDGLRRVARGYQRTRLADDLISADLFGLSPMVAGIPEMRFGLNAKQVLNELGNQGKLQRFRTEKWIEAEGDGPVVDVFRANIARDLSHYAQSWQSFKDRLNARKTDYLQSAFLAVDYITAHQEKDGRFDYQYFPFRGERAENQGSYSLARHAGAIYGLSQLFEHHPNLTWKHTADLAIAWLHRQTRAECEDRFMDAICIPAAFKAGLGEQALPAIAILKYSQTTKDLKWLNFAKGLLNFIVKMQRGDGEFFHTFRTDTNAIEIEERNMFASEQAAFALILGAKLFKESDPKQSEIYLKAGEKALDYLTTQKYQDFLSSFFYGADHWTCLASLEAFDLLPKRTYLDFCLGYVRFLKRLQFTLAEVSDEQGDFIGHYGFGFFSPPQAPATGGFGEAVMSTLILAQKHHLSDEEIEDLYEQAFLGSEALVHDQIKSSNSWRMPKFELAQGAFRRSTAESEVRIDFVQHCASALGLNGGLR
jgi:hypothetical protein